MIWIDRTRAKAPSELIVEGAKRLDAHRKSPPKRAMDFDRDVYAAKKVKAALHAMQDEKCSYCEKRCERAYEDVEHFRPKTQSIRGAGVVEPGYWWLAYSFENLLFSCIQCNRTKSSKFPLKLGARALRPEEDPRVTREDALLLDPCLDRPEEHLTFRRLPTGFQIAPKTERGAETIKVLGLDRDELSSHRRHYHRKHLQPVIKRFKRAKATGNAQELGSCRKDARALTARDAEFSLFARIILTSEGLLSHRAKGAPRS